MIDDDVMLSEIEGKSNKAKRFPPLMAQSHFQRIGREMMRMRYELVPF